MIKTVSIVVTNKEGKILALKRSENKTWYPKMWDIISGKIKESESPDECFNREIFEEINISIFKNIEKKNSYVYEENGKKWLVYPYRCTIESDDIILNREHSEYKWMTLKEIMSVEHSTPLKKELSIFYKIENFY
ncbi:MAG: NUDIX domain-containing protein [Candidatus Colwellbacteria bacterium]|jgi:8-oxo-dGTP diphosphatase|nr:NUDIX domain-containing protein [Candidatus Colwellbacteria bacterium]MCK9497751.1 NUDIX domain-containing protein [Candidatus Colwellbacteria bacterium]MDD3752606.1 NUDIX domain-containing protein [Candidatus Colwellbacteria bacterium]MDD4818829.1 NUDIX domain-containing protein [Candidatus Colwellbacteria bacterium]